MSKNTNSGVVIGGAKKKLHVGPRVRVAILAAAGLIVLAGLATGAWLIAQKIQDDKDAKKQEMTINGKPLTDTQKSQQAIYYGKYDQGQSLLQDQVDAAKTPDEKVTIYMQLATNSLNKQKYDDANSYAQKALTVKKTAAVYSMLAQIAAKQGNKTKALAYVEQWKAALDPKSPQYEMALSDVNEFIASINK